eukprot:10039312-Alexandrium_andersonii.AAC.1
MQYQPQYARGQIIMLRRANCRSFFPQLAQWHLEMDGQSRQICQNGTWRWTASPVRSARRLARPPPLP